MLATSTKTGKTQAEPVTSVLLHHHDTDLYDLTIKTAHGAAVIDAYADDCPLDNQDPTGHDFIEIPEDGGGCSVIGGLDVSAGKGDDIDGGDSNSGDGHRVSVAYDTRFE